MSAATDAAFLQQLDDALQRDLCGYWFSKRGGASMPGRADIDPVEIPQLLVDIAMVDALPGEVSYAFRVVGSRLADLCMEDFTGVTLDAAPLGAWRDFLRGLFTDVVRSRTAILSTCDVDFLNGERCAVNQLCLPLSSGQAPSVGKIIFSPRFKRVQDTRYPKPLPWSTITGVTEGQRVRFG